MSCNPVSELYFGQPFRVTLGFDVLTDIRDVFVEVDIGKPDGTEVVFSTTVDEGQGPVDLMTGRYQVNADFDIVLLPGQYSIGLGIHFIDGMTIDFIRRVLDFRVLKVRRMDMATIYGTLFGAMCVVFPAGECIKRVQMLRKRLSSISHNKIG